MIKPERVQFPPDCEWVVRAIWEYLDGAMDADRLTDMEDHLAWCEYCRAHTDFERRLMTEIGRIRREHVGGRALRERVTTALRDAGMGRSEDEPDR